MHLADHVVNAKILTSKKLSALKEKHTDISDELKAADNDQAKTNEDFYKLLIQYADYFHPRIDQCIYDIGDKAKGIFSEEKHNALFPAFNREVLSLENRLNFFRDVCRYILDKNYPAHPAGGPNTSTAAGKKSPQSESKTKASDENSASSQATDMSPSIAASVVSGSALDVLKNRSVFEISTDIVIDDDPGVNFKAIKNLCLAGRSLGVLLAAATKIENKTKAAAIIKFLLSQDFINERDILELDQNLYNQIQSLRIKR